MLPVDRLEHYTGRGYEWRCRSGAKSRAVTPCHAKDSLLTEAGGTLDRGLRARHYREPGRAEGGEGVLRGVGDDLDGGRLPEPALFRGEEDSAGPLRVYLDPVVLTAREAELLDSEAGVPAMRRRRETGADDGIVIEAVVTVLRPGSAQFFVELPPPAL